jgi:hypothetical protein
VLAKHLSGNEENRDAQSQNFVARVFWPSEFLRQGITVVDTPGLNESDGIDSMVSNGLDSFATTAIYIQVVSLKDQFGANVSPFSLNFHTFFTDSHENPQRYHSKLLCSVLPW